MLGEERMVKHQPPSKRPELQIPMVTIKSVFHPEGLNSIKTFLKNYKKKKKKEP